MALVLTTSIMRSGDAILESSWVMRTLSGLPAAPASPATTQHTRREPGDVRAGVGGGGTGSGWHSLDLSLTDCHGRLGIDFLGHHHSSMSSAETTACTEEPRPRAAPERARRASPSPPRRTAPLPSRMTRAPLVNEPARAMGVQVGAGGGAPAVVGTRDLGRCHRAVAPIGARSRRGDTFFGARGDTRAHPNSLFDAE